MTAGASDFVWYDVMTTDTAKAAEFYKAVIGWNVTATGPNDYLIFSVGSAMVAGLMAIPFDDHKAPPAWSGYIGVDDVDAYTRKVEDAGGATYVPPTDIADVGRFSVVADPQGAMFMLFRMDGPKAPEVAPMTPGHIGWHELLTSDPKAALSFYSQLFGWTRAEALEMGPLGTYQMFSAGARPIGGMMKMPSEVPHPCWLFYINVKALDEAVAATLAHGGRIVQEPTEVPGGSWVAQGIDPQGAVFAMVASHR